MKKLILLAMIFMAIACKKKKESSESSPAATPAPVNPGYSAKDFIPMKTGNYWIYKTYVYTSYDSLLFTMTDSLYIADTMALHSHTFHNLVGGPPTGLSGYLADSADCIINSGSVIVFRMKDNDTILVSNFPPFSRYEIMRKLTQGYMSNNVTYSNCYNAQAMFYNSSPGFACPVRAFDQVFSAGIGVVGGTYGYSNMCNKYIYELIRYKLN